MAGPAKPGVRVSDADRDKALATLRDGFAAGRLTDDTFAHRAEAALLARVAEDLHAVVADLPRPWRLGAAVTGASAAGRRVLRSADRWLRGWPPVLQLPSGPQRRFTIGREPACDLTVAHETVSRWHASLRRDGDSWLLDDLGSTNGTRLNGWRVTTGSRLAAGDLVSFGAVTFEVADRHR